MEIPKGTPRTKQKRAKEPVRQGSALQESVLDQDNETLEFDDEDSSSEGLQKGSSQPNGQRLLSPREHFRKFLQEGQYRITPERFEVLDAVLQWDDHFDADNLFIYLKSNGSKVSRATVYKTLNLLHECGLVSRYRFSQGHAQYEKTTDRPHHDHMVCTKCGKIIEFENSHVVRLQDDTCATYGFKPTYHSFQIFGICLECSSQALTTGGGREHAVQGHAIPVGAHPVVNGGATNGGSVNGGSKNGKK